MFAGMSIEAVGQRRSLELLLEYFKFSRPRALCKTRHRETLSESWSKNVQQTGHNELHTHTLTRTEADTQNTLEQTQHARINQHNTTQHTNKPAQHNILEQTRTTQHTRIY